MRMTFRIATAAMCAVLALVSAFATAQQNAAHLSVAVPPEDIAQSIVIFVPTVDTPLVTADEEVYLKGRIVQVERGERPGAIVMNPHTLWGVRPAGIPVRMYLVRHPDKDAYYPIYGAVVPDAEFAAAMATAAPATSAELKVRITGPLGQAVHAAELVGVPYNFGAEIRVPAHTPLARADLYLGVTLAGGAESYTWISPAGSPYFSKGMQPLVRDLVLEGGAVLDTALLAGNDLLHRFTGGEAPGMYLVFAMLVNAGADPGDTANWLAVDMKPLYVD